LYFFVAFLFHVSYSENDMSRKKIFYNPNLKELARELRKNSTLSEVLLWNELKKKKVKRV